MEIQIPFNAAHALFAATICSACYEPGEVSGLGFPVQRFVAGDELALYGQLPGLGVLAIRGTRTWRQWVANLKVRQNQKMEDRREADGQTAYAVHRGFDDAATRMLTKLSTSGVSITPGSRLFITGHSLGKAIARRIAYWVQKAGLPVVRVYDFGGPREGDSRWASTYEAELGQVTFGLVNNNDIVPRLPPYWYRNYRHAGRMVYIDHQGNLHPDSPRRPLGDQLAGRWAALLHRGTDGTEDHPISQYLAALRRHASYRLPLDLAA